VGSRYCRFVVAIEEMSLFVDSSGRIFQVVGDSVLECELNGEFRC
jgi:hypothetical protein